MSSSNLKHSNLQESDFAAFRYPTENGTKTCSTFEDSFNTSSTTPVTAPSPDDTEVYVEIRAVKEEADFGGEVSSTSHNQFIISRNLNTAKFKCTG